MSFETTLKRRPARRDEPERPALRVLYIGGRGLVREEPIALAPGATKIGRAVAAGEGISLADDRRASRYHATVHVSSDGSAARIVDESSTGTEVDGEVVREADLEDGALVRTGDSFLLFRRLRGPTVDGSAGGLAGDAPSIRMLRCTIDLVAPTEATVLLLGESGSGKEVAARALHEGSGRKGPLVAVNCSAITESLAESQLFGHVAGAFSGSRGDSPGFFRAAHGGTLLLDEIGDLPPALQPKLLRALEERAVTPVGGTTPVPVDVRVVAATHRDLLGAVSAKEFRGDLYARLGELVIEVPALRERREDVLPLLVAALGDDAPRLSPDLVSALLLHTWPFNVRELLKIAMHLRVRGAGRAELDVDLLEDRLARTSSLVPKPHAEGSDRPAPGPHSREAAPEASAAGVPDQETLVGLLREYRGVIADVARATGRSRKQVYRWLEQHGLDAKDFAG